MLDGSASIFYGRSYIPTHRRSRLYKREGRTAAQECVNVSACLSVCLCVCVSGLPVVSSALVDVRGGWTALSQRYPTSLGACTPAGPDGLREQN
mmetsp:Transcript_23734/g.68276  ORF Transcript_23734/g.68276 Transcript_23734/m.68276 type:complete len:94 (-) Transcript_23734:696-977(-)